ncbi:MAG: CidA/LrgA family protein [Lachnospiraceae bacterium]|nr:CidA/LrgA family protein [Lachnospiraceae bacterium]
MKYIFQTGIIFAITLIGEILAGLLPLPIPGSIYGLILLFLLLLTGVLKLKYVEGAGNFFLAILPFLFISNCVSLMDSMELLGNHAIVIVVLTIVSTLLVMVVTGGVAQFFISRRKKAEVKEATEGGAEHE